MFGLNGGELFTVVFIVAAVLSWSLWPRAGEAIAEKLAGGAAPDPAPESERNPPAGD